MTTIRFSLGRRLDILGLILSATILTTAQAGVPFPSADTPKAIDRGTLDARSRAVPISVTLTLGLRSVNDAESLVQSLYKPGDPQFHKFLTADQFTARFAPGSADVAKVILALGNYGLRAQQATATTLKVTGLPADMERAFSVSLHSFEVPAHGAVSGYTFHAPLSHAVIPAEISGQVTAVVGLDSRPVVHPFYKSSPPVARGPQTTVPSTTTTTDTPGSWTVADFAQYYDVQPLYSGGLSGKGRTIGILTFASFTPTDAYSYWSSLGLKVASNRIEIVDVDGGPGAPSDVSGSIETTLDVEQSGGIAPGANIVVYQAPNTSQGFVDVFAAAVDVNMADSLSMSWGTWEWFDNFQNSPVTDPSTGKIGSDLSAAHELLIRAALQGMTPFTSSGDGGAFTANDVLGCFGPYSSADPNSCSLTLSVDYPASDPLITAAGGTTLAGTQQYCLTSACTAPFYDVVVQHESVWGWDYLAGLCQSLGFSGPVACGTFPAGSGGGVSIEYPIPAYQNGILGVRTSEPLQVFRAGEGFAQDGIGLQYTLPAFYAGRNVPDVSFNADPNTGYTIYYTSDQSGFAVYSFYGGTSFVAPQLNGVSALMGQYLKQRIGLLNVPLYTLLGTGNAYTGFKPPLNPIAYGDNWFYRGSYTYNPGAGVGTMDVANFALYLHGLF